MVVGLSDVTEDEAPVAELPGDGLRESIVDELRRHIGDALVEHHLAPQDDLWIRVRPDGWAATGRALSAMGFTYFCFLSALDWKPSPFGRGEDDPTQPPPERQTAIEQGVAGGETRFQVFARVTDTTRHVGVTIKADVAEETMAIDTWQAIYAGANWHERETHEMFGIDFIGHPDLRNMYLPSGFEGFPLRKDFPLLARMVKPWPGIVDVEPMPAEEVAEGSGSAEAAPVEEALEGGAAEHPETAADPADVTEKTVEDAPAHPAADPDSVSRQTTSDVVVGDTEAGPPAADASNTAFRASNRQHSKREPGGGRVVTDVLSQRQQLAYIAGQAADARLNVELETEGMTLNIGPQHPATHGTLRIIVRLDGEQVVWAEPSAGYMHRGYEKLAEVRTFPQVTTLVNRIDWLGSFANEVPFILAAEKLMEIEAPPRAQHIRTILFELSRIANITLFLGDLGVQLGAVTPAFFAFRDREHVLNLIESVTGGRFHPNFDRIGGLKDDFPKGFIDDCRYVMKKIRGFCDENEDLLIGNEIFQARTRGVGIIPRDVALQYGLSGPNLRASGVDWDLRRDQKLPMAWDKVDWRVWTHPDGDSFARCWIRLQETREATKIVDQLLDTLPAGPIMAKVPRIIKVPAGEAWVSTENPLGEMGYYVVSKGDLGPFRVKIRSASFNNVSIASWVLRGVYVPDIITILASLYFILGDIDR